MEDEEEWEVEKEVYYNFSHWALHTVSRCCGESMMRRRKESKVHHFSFSRRCITLSATGPYTVYPDAAEGVWWGGERSVRCITSAWVGGISHFQPLGLTHCIQILLRVYDEVEKEWKVHHLGLSGRCITLSATGPYTLYPDTAESLRWGGERSVRCITSAWVGGMSHFQPLGLTHCIQVLLRVYDEMRRRKCKVHHFSLSRKYISLSATKPVSVSRYCWESMMRKRKECVRCITSAWVGVVSHF